MLKPKALKLGDTIGIVAPSSPTTKKNVKFAKLQLENLGFKVKLGSSCFANHGYLAGKDRLRADDLNNIKPSDIISVNCLTNSSLWNIHIILYISFYLPTSYSLKYIKHNFNNFVTAFFENIP